MKNRNIGAASYAFVVSLMISMFAGYGYVCNIVKLFQASNISGTVVARAIGVIVAPLGALLGYL